MDEFLDIHGSRIRLAFQQYAFATESTHVLVICRYYDKWLLTHHKQRGWEFPGGKKEIEETLEQSARREVFEETGGIIEKLYPIGEYEVSDHSATFVKTIFYGIVNELHRKKSYLETNGPVFEKGDILVQRFQDSYSFIMKDGVIEKSINFILKMEGMNIPTVKAGVYYS